MDYKKKYHLLIAITVGIATFFVAYVMYTQISIRNLVFFEPTFIQDSTNIYWLERSDPSGSGSFVSYSLYLYQRNNKKVKVIFRGDEDALYQGGVELTKNDTELVTEKGYPREDDPNSSPSRILKRYYSIKGETVKFEREEIIEVTP